MLYLETSEDRASYRCAVAQQGLERFGLTLRKAAEVLATSHTNGISLNTEIPQSVPDAAEQLTYEWRGWLVSTKNRPFCFFA